MKSQFALALLLVIGVAAIVADSKESLPKQVLECMDDVSEDAEKLTSKLKRLLKGDKVTDEELLEKFRKQGPMLGKNLYLLTQEMLQLGPFLGISKDQEQVRLTQSQQSQHQGGGFVPGQA